MKFGGTSVGSPERIETAARLIAHSAQSHSVVVILSAMSKVTDLLLDTLNLAEQGQLEDVEANLVSLRQRHREACAALLPPEAQEVANERIDQIIDDFGRIARGMLMLGEKPPRSVDDAVTTGEKLSVLLCTALLRSRGAAAEAIHGTDLIVTDDQFGDAPPIIEATSEKTRARLQPLLDKTARSLSSPVSMAQPTTAYPSPSAVAVRTFRPLSSPPLSTRRSCGSGPTWTAFSPPTRASFPARAS